MIRPYYAFAPVTWSNDGEYRGCMSQTKLYPYNGTGTGTAYTTQMAHGLAKDFGGMGWGCGGWQHGHRWESIGGGRGDGNIFKDGSNKQ